MKRKNRIFQNHCTVRGRIVDLEPIKGIRGPEDLFLLVETELPDDELTEIPCVAAGKMLKHLKVPLTEGDWVTVSGRLIIDKKEKLCWIEARMVDLVEEEDDQVYVNSAVFQGEIREGSFLFHLCIAGFQYRQIFIVDVINTCSVLYSLICSLPVICQGIDCHEIVLD